MIWAADSAVNPSPQELADTDCLFIGRYVGTPYQRYGVSRGYIDDCLGHNVGVLLIFEEWSNQFLGGYQAAVDSCARMMDSWNRLGAPLDGSVLPAVVLVDPNPGIVSGNENALRDYARGWNDVLPFNEFSGYGSRYGLDIAGGVAPKMTRRWGVGTWGYGEGPGGSLPDDVPADLIQHGNRGAPVANCDYNTVFRRDMGQWGGPVPPPSWTGGSQGDMDAICAPLLDGTSTLIVKSGTQILWDLTAPQAGGFLGILPNHPDLGYALNGSGGDRQAIPVRDVDYGKIDDARKAWFLTLNPPTGGGGGNPDKPIGSFSDQEIADEANRRVSTGDLKVTGTTLTDA